MERPKHLAAQLVYDAIPKFNPVIANGIASEHFRYLEKYVDQILRDSSDYFTEGLRYVGYRRATPEEEVRFLLEKKATSKTSHWTVELAESTIYLIILEFDYNGTPIHHEIYLPYLVKGSQMWIRGTINAILPVLTAPVFSVETLKQQIFLKLLVSKLTFKRLNHTVIQDDRDVILSVVWSAIHRHNPKNSAHYEAKKDESVKMYPASAIYLFCEYGLTEAFLRYGHFVPILSMGDYEFGEDVNREDYVVFKSRQRKPNSVKTKYYQPHDIQLIIPKEKVNDVMVLGLVAGFFYIADSYSQFMTSLDELNEPEFWKIILGKVCFRTKDNVAVLLEQTERHMTNVRRMLDNQQKTDLRNCNIDIDNMIDLLAYVIGHFPSILRETEDGNLYGKRLLVLRNVLEDLIVGINMLTFKPANRKVINEKSVKTEISRRLIPDKILSLQSTPYREIISSPTDCVVLRHTPKFLLQNNISKRNKSGVDVNIADPDKHHHASVMEIGTYQAIKESEVTGRLLLSPYQQTTQSGITKSNPQFEKTIAYLDFHLSRG